MRVPVRDGSKVHRKYAAAPGAGNSSTACFGGVTSAIRHSILPELLLWVVPRVPARKGPESSTDSTSASIFQLSTLVQKFHANSGETGHSTECSNFHSCDMLCAPIGSG